MAVLHINISSWLFFILLSFSVQSGYAQSDETELDGKLYQLILQHQLSGDPSQGRDIPSINTPLAQLGKVLFFSRILSGQHDTACVTCHHPLLGGGDGLSLPIGVEAVDAEHLGPGREHSNQGVDYDGTPTVPRNAPTTFNVALWDSVLFHDGRVERLSKRTGSDSAIRTPDSFFGTEDPMAGANLVEAQARFPVTSEEEMRGYGFMVGKSNDEVRAALARRFFEGDEKQQHYWLRVFRQGFEQPLASAEQLITFANITRALATYQRSQLFVESPWNGYVKGDAGALSLEEKKGAVLFFSKQDQGGADCVACHKGDFFSDEQFHVIAIPQVGRGKKVGFASVSDFGRFAITKDARDRYAFRTPSLLNVEVTSPYGHDGAYITLEGIVRHHLNPQHAVDNYDPSQLGMDVDMMEMKRQTQKALNKLQAQRRQFHFPVLTNLTLSEEQIANLVAFLKSLTDPCVKDASCLAPWLVENSDEVPELLRVKINEVKE